MTKTSIDGGVLVVGSASVVAGADADAARGGGGKPVVATLMVSCVFLSAMSRRLRILPRGLRKSELLPSLWPCLQQCAPRRLAMFTPCFARRNPSYTSYRAARTPKPEVEKWFPGTCRPGCIKLLVSHCQIKCPERDICPGVAELTELVAVASLPYAGAHYDLGRQRFVVGRYHHGAESLLRRALDLTNFMHTNVTYNHELSKPPLQFLIEGVQAVDRAVLPSAVHVYLPAAPDSMPPTWSLPWVAPWTTNAYDNIAETFGARLLKQLPGRSTLQLVLSDQVVRDRHIPIYHYAAQHFWGSHASHWERRFRSLPARQKSRAFDVWEVYR
jgi:hypothetical protein